MTDAASAPRRRIMVTGCAGFIGFHLARRLLHDGWAVVGADNLNPYYDVGLKEARLARLTPLPGFTFHRIDLADRAAVDKMEEAEGWKAEPIVHLAAQVGVRYSRRDPESYLRSNIIGFFNVLELAKRCGCPHFIYASSSSVYGGNRKLPFSVHDNVDHPLSFYAATKKADELMAHVYSSMFGLPTTGLRFFTVYGPWGRPDMAMYQFTRAVVQGETLRVNNFGDMLRDFTYIDDIIEGIVRLVDRAPEPNPTWDAEHPDPGTSWAPYRVYNIGNHQPVPLMEFIRVIEASVGRKAQVEFGPMEPGEMQKTYAEVDDLRAAVGFSPETTIYEGVPRFVEWFKEYHHITS